LYLQVSIELKSYAALSGLTAPAYLRNSSLVGRGVNALTSSCIGPRTGSTTPVRRSSKATDAESPALACSFSVIVLCGSVLTAPEGGPKDATHCLGHSSAMTRISKMTKRGSGAVAGRGYRRTVDDVH
jgi:hypothetical protein